MCSKHRAILYYVCIWFLFSKSIKATEVNRCSDDKPFPLNVNVYGCDASPCDVVKGKDITFEVHFVAHNYFTKGTTLAKATTLGFSLNYELPEDVRNVCTNLMYGAYCPVYATEDVTYLFEFPIGNYPEIGVRVEITIVDQNNGTVACFSCNIKVKKGNGNRRNEGTIYEVDWLA